MTKLRKEVLDASLPDGEVVRCTVSMEEVGAPPVDRTSLAVEMVRFKERASFSLHGTILFELTRVYSGPSEAAALAAAPEYEVELEWCGSAAAAAARPGEWDAAAAATSFAVNIQFLLSTKRAAGARP